MKTRGDILQKAVELTTGDRVGTYGDPTEQHNIAGRMWDIYKGAVGDKYTTAHDAAMFQVILKISRVANGNFKDDNYVDGAAYFGIAFEAQQKFEDLCIHVADHH